MDQNRLIPVALAILWGLNWPAVKIALAEVPPFALRMGGLGVAAFLLLGTAFVAGRRLTVARRDLWPLFVAGMLNVAVFNLATVFAQLNTTTSRAAVLTFTTPLWAILFAYVFLGERLDRFRVAALAIGLVGIALLAAPLATGGITPLGILFPMIAAVGWAAGTVYLKAYPIGGDRMVVTAYQLIIATVVSAAGFLAAGEVMPTALSPKGALAIGFHIVGATALAYLLWFTLLDRVSAGAAAMTTFAIPVVGVAGAMALVGERPTPLDYAGFAAVLAAAGIALIASRPAPARRE